MSTQHQEALDVWCTPIKQHITAGTESVSMIFLGRGVPLTREGIHASDERVDG